jgi:hypothetical protein
MFQLLCTAVVASVAWLVSAVATYELASWLHPARTSEGHPVMPIAQVFWAILVATVVAGIVVAFAIRAHARRRLTNPPMASAPPRPR